MQVKVRFLMRSIFAMFPPEPARLAGFLSNER